MVLPTNDADPALEQVYQNFKADASRMRAQAKGFSDDIAAGNTQQVRLLVGMYEDFWSHASRWDAYRDTPGIAAYVKSRWDGDPALDVAAEFNAVKAELDSFLSWARTNIPKSANGHLEERKIEPDGALTWNTRTAAQLGSLKTRLDALIATVAL